MSANPHKYNGLIVDPDLDNRMRLKQATVAVPLFGVVRQCGTFREALQALSGDEDHFEVVFISHRLPEMETGSFITEAKGVKAARDAAFVHILKPSRDGGASFANQMVQGFDGFLVEPYSVNSLVEITELASRVKKERGESRAKMAITMLLKDAMEQLDLVAFMKSAGYEIGKSWGKFKEMCSGLRSFSENYLDICVNSVVKAFSEAPLPKRFLQMRKYSGVSDRVKKRMEAKVLAAQEETLRTSGATPALVKKSDT